MFCILLGLSAVQPVSAYLISRTERFPEPLELITGRFPHLSPAFYEWRIQNRKELLRAEPNRPDLLDDLAVALDKTGRSAEAIGIMRAKERVHPGLYETAANLGTFLIHAGRLEEGLAEIQRAIRIQPGANRGRERWQQFVVEYQLWRKAAGHAGLPLQGGTLAQDPEHGFLAFLTRVKKLPVNQGLRWEALLGVLHLMRAGDHASPVVLELLGQIYLARHLAGDPEDQALPLATRAFLMASQVAPAEAARRAYREMAADAVARGGLGRNELGRIEKEFRKERGAADDWSGMFVRKQKQWIADGESAEDKLYEFTLEHFRRPDELKWEEEREREEGMNKAPLWFGACLGAVLVHLIRRARAHLR